MGLDRATQGDERFAQFAIIWTIRNRARGAAGRANIEQEFSAALSPVAARLALGAVEEIMRLLAASATAPIHVHPVPCCTISTDEHRIVLICRAIQAGNAPLAARIAAELVGQDRADALSAHIRTLVLALRDGSAAPQPPACGRTAVPLHLH